MLCHLAIYAQHKTLYMPIGLLTPTTATAKKFTTLTLQHAIGDSTLLMHYTALAYKTDHIYHTQYLLGCSHLQQTSLCT